MQWTGKVLVVDDDKDICDMVSIALKAEGFQVDTAFDGKTALDLMNDNNYEVIVLDIMLPVLDGWEVCRRIRSGPQKGVSIIMLTAKTSEADRILGFQIGADDYVVKPFSPRELTIRVQALIRRSREYNKAKVINVSGLTVDISGYRVLSGDKNIEMSPKEFELLALLIQQPGQLFSREEILQRIWGYDYQGNTRTVDEHIKRLRQKLDTGQFQYIQTVWGIGYKFEVRPK
jgi:DNA-binding response OmpR family regulator